MTLFKANRIDFSYSPALFVYFALLLLFVPLRLLIAAAASAVIHELFHILAMKTMGLRVDSIHLGIRGAVISAQPMTKKQELVCALAGPLGGTLLIVCYRWIPVISLCGLVQSAYNLLPLRSTDGGNVLRCCTNLLFTNSTSQRIITCAEIFTLSIITAVCFYGAFHLRLGIIPIAFACSVLLQSARRK